MRKLRLVTKQEIVESKQRKLDRMFILIKGVLIGVILSALIYFVDKYVY